MIKVSLTKNKKMRILFICTVGIAVSLISYLLYIKVNNYLDERGAVKAIEVLVDNSKKGNERGVRDCFIKEYQRSLDAYKKHNPEKSLFDWKIIKLEDIKQIPRKYGEFAICKPDFINSLNWSKTKVFYAKVIKKTDKEYIGNYKGVNYLIFNVTKRNNIWKIVNVGYVSMSTIIKDKIGFGDKKEIDLLNREKKMLRYIKYGTGIIDDYREMLIPQYNKNKSVTYNKSYSKLKDKAKFICIDTTYDGVGNKCYIKDKSNIIKIIRAFDKLRCQLPMIKRYNTMVAKYVCVVHPKIKGHKELFVNQQFMIEKYCGKFYYCDFMMPPRVLPKELIELLNI
jgi:galactitol-specific phosphotransferase system IIB component